VAGDRHGRGRRLAIALIVSAAMGGCGGSTAAKPSAGPSATLPVGDAVAEARANVDTQLAAGHVWPSPPAGPRATGAKRIAYIAGDMGNGGISGVYAGVTEAAARIGWTVKKYDGKAAVEGRTIALEEALASNPDAIVLGGFDPGEQPAAMAEVHRRRIPVVGWHAGAASGPDAAGSLFTNVTTDVSEVARLAVDYAIATSDGHAGVAIFTDSTYQIAIQKADMMKARLERCGGCEVLAFQDTPIDTAKDAMPPLVSSLVGRYGTRLTYLLAINGNYFAGSATALRQLGKPGAGAPWAVAAGDGDGNEFARIRTQQYQTASVAEPLPLQGWQLVDELNRAFSGLGPSGYVAPPALITRDTVPAGSVFDPPGAWREAYLAVWGR
jgi:ribose transport system substrate-binding protein